MSKLTLNEDDSFIKMRVNSKDAAPKKYIEVEFNKIVGGDVMNAIVSLAGIVGGQTGSKPEAVLLDIVTSISTEPVIQKQVDKD